MSKSKLTPLFLILAAALLLVAAGEAIAGGGNFPSNPGDLLFLTFDTSDGITAVIVLDPNGPIGAPATSTGTSGKITITKPNARGKPAKTATATFQVPPGSNLGDLRLGCNLFLTNTRFVEFSSEPLVITGVPLGSPDPFGNWLPADVTTRLFNQLGVPLVDPVFGNPRIPGVNSVISQECVPFPQTNGPSAPGPLAGILGIQAAASEAFARVLGAKGALTYPDRTITDPLTGLLVTDVMNQWFPGFLVLEVTIGIWK